MLQNHNCEDNLPTLYIWPPLEPCSLIDNTAAGFDDWDELEKHLWSTMFHPQYGYCHTFNMRLATQKALNPISLSQIDLLLKTKEMFGILHEENHLPDDTDRERSTANFLF